MSPEHSSQEKLTRQPVPCPQLSPGLLRSSQEASRACPDPSGKINRLDAWPGSACCLYGLHSGCLWTGVPAQCPRRDQNSSHHTQKQEASIRPQPPRPLGPPFACVTCGSDLTPHSVWEGDSGEDTLGDWVGVRPAAEPLIPPAPQRENHGPSSPWGGT